VTSVHASFPTARPRATFARAATGGAALVATLCAFLAGCATSRPTHFYTLDPVPSSTRVELRSPMHVQVAAVHIPATLDRRELARESAAGTLELSEQDLWGAPLDEMVRRILTQDLMQRLPEDAVVLPQQPAPSKTRAIVVDLVELGADASGAVSLDGSWSLLAAGSDEPLLRNHLRLTTAASPAYADQPRALSQLLSQLADHIAQTLSARCGPGPGC